MKSARKVAVLLATVTTSVGVAAALPATASAAPKKPHLHVYGAETYPPGRLLRDTIVGSANLGNQGHLGCMLTRRVDRAPKPGVKAKLPEKDGYYFTIKDHNLNPNRKYYYKLRCGTPYRTVAADSAYPTKPVNG